jgi:hypothetical protein
MDREFAAREGRGRAGDASETEKVGTYESFVTLAPFGLQRPTPNAPSQATARKASYVQH